MLLPFLLACNFSLLSCWFAHILLEACFYSVVRYLKSLVEKRKEKRFKKGIVGPRGAYTPSKSESG